MAPTSQPTWLTPIPTKRSLFRRDINDGSLVSLIITAIILSILVVGIIIYLFRKTWSKMVEPRLSRSSNTNSAKVSYKLPSLRPSLSSTKSSPVLPTYRQSMRARSCSDALWSEKLDHEVDYFSSTDGSSSHDETAYLPRYSSRKTSSASSLSLSRRHCLSLSLTTSPAFQPLDMLPIYEGTESAAASPVLGHEARPLAPRRSLSETQIQRPMSVPAKSRPLGSHPVNNDDKNATSIHRCSGSFDAAGRDMLRRQRSAGRLEQVDLI
ncbi:uncharacterized protein AB675_5729 [Cyphellophora attinorum]|uniref:Uncharacterized protein n=1 Tax=Cyphellophora attinorum TaxID=1664694 RepID=A0A0N0NL05_9EURO|nr:uncharacterized protein AB675_5729 [Phialophora attinorum]KPI38741.1 hypothetical protein AB675_5729 [Phialophora attinorum]